MLLKTLKFFKIITPAKKWREEEFKNRSLIFFQEARRRDLEIHPLKILGKNSEYFNLIYKNKEFFYKEIPLYKGSFGKIDIDDKYSIKKFLRKNGLPIAEGQVFIKEKKALEYAKNIGFPLVVKPNDGSLSCHSTVEINNESELKRAIRIAKKFRPNFIVEKFIAGDLFRASVIAGNKVFICKKERANVVGNGVSSIKNLIDTKNSDLLRNDESGKNVTLHKIPLNREFEKLIKDQGFEISSIPSNGKKIFLQKKITLAAGCDIIDYTPETNNDNLNLFIKIAELLKTDLIGIDFICPDIKKSYLRQKTAILETNSLPYVDMHQYPSKGKNYDIAKIVWDIFEKRNNGMPPHRFRGAGARNLR